MQKTGIDLSQWGSMQNTRLLAGHVAQLSYEMIPKETVERTKTLILHVLAASLASADMEQAKAAGRIAMRKGGEGKATIWGSPGWKASPEDAAFANGTTADILDWEDCSWTGHPSAGAVSVALALGEAMEKSGKEVIEAIVAGYDVYQRIAMSVQLRPEEWGVPGHSWGLTCWQIFSGAAAAAKLYGFDRDQVATHLAVTTHFTTIPGAVREESDVYHYAHGICARNGIAAAEIVEVGVDPIRYPLDGPRSLGHQLHDTVDESWYTRELGQWFAVDDTLLKHWPANMWIQAPLDALDALVKEHGFTMGDIEAVEVAPTVDLYARPIREPRTVMKAEFSLPYCFGAYLKQPEASAHWYDPQLLNDEEIREFEKRVSFLPPSRNPLEQFMEFWKGEFPDCRVDIRLKDGRELSKSVKYPKGHPRNPFTWEEECRHFIRCGACLPMEQRETVIRCVRELEKLDNIRELCSCLMVKGADDE